VRPGAREVPKGVEIGTAGKEAFVPIDVRHSCTKNPKTPWRREL
jgi:hypothetical protein